MPQNYFITGQPKAGKTTLLKDLVKELKSDGLKVGGFISPEERHSGTRTAFQVMDIDSGKKAGLADVKGDGPKVSKYHVDVKSFESIAVPSMERFESYDVFVIDEIGAMEMKSSRFSKLLDRILESETPLIATLNDQFVDIFGGSGEVVALDEDNRQAVYLRLLRKAKESIKRKPAPKEEKKEAPKKAKKAVKEKPVKKVKEKPPAKEAQPKPAEGPHAHVERKAPPKKESIVDRIKKLFG
ncbi:MAG: nucleoside-triphosphatase [Candidatus Micrarchaeia archaeon]